MSPRFSFAVIVVLMVVVNTRSQSQLTCDGETTRTCDQCVALLELGSTCSFCKSDGRCVGRFDASTTCPGGFTTNATGCRSSSTVTAPTLRPTPPASRPSLLTHCPTYRGGCDRPADFCAQKGEYLACATSSDQCHNFNFLSTQFDASCPQVKCTCTPVANPCLPDGSQVATQCTLPVDDCARCSTCECQLRCCTSACIAMGYGVADGKCDAQDNKPLVGCTCRPKGAAEPTTTAAQSPTPGPIGACSPGASGCVCKQGQCDVANANCVDGLCLVLGCVEGEVGCPFRSDNTCSDDLACRNNKCVFANPCAVPGNLGCQCAGSGTCKSANPAVASCDAASKVCINVRQFTCSLGDPGCWCRTDDTCGAQQQQCVDVARRGRKSCVFKGLAIPAPIAPTPPRIVPECAANQLRNRAATRCGVDPADCEADQAQLACVAQVYAKCEEFLKFDKCNSAHAISGSCLVMCPMTSSSSSTMQNTIAVQLTIIAFLKTYGFF
jgi:hypothetical protein